ncbi:MAG: hydrogenase maturation peptidase HycI [Elusimicrobia bacterium]|nr:hydrogenase maturation peptidase HycI [Candidatus Liberimonas magnetica]
MNKLKTPVLFLGIGNILKGDDAAGPKLVSLLEPKQSVKLLTIDCGDVPENYIGKIKSLKPASIIFVDAVEMNKKPGTVKLFRTDEIINFNISTHGMPLTMLSGHLVKETSAKIYLLGIQPKSLNMGEEISIEVEWSINKLAESLI